MNRQSIYKYLICDIVAAFIVWIAFFLFRRVFNDFTMIENADNTPYFAPSYQLWLSMVFLPICSIAIHYLTGFYNLSKPKSRLDELFLTFTSAFFVSLTAFFVLITDDIVVEYTFYYKAVLTLFALHFVITYLFRFTITLSIFNKYKNGKESVPLLIVGTGETAANIAKTINQSKKYIGRQLIGFVTIKGGQSVDNNKILGNTNDLEDVIKTHNIKEVIIAIDNMDDQIVFSLINRMLEFGVHIMFAPRMYEIITGNVMLGDISSEPLVAISGNKMAAWQQSIKRVFDVFTSAIMLIILSPLYIYLITRVKLDSKGSVFYKQPRVGYKGREFFIYKFRTMVSDAENGTPKLTNENDPRITRFGNTMRKYRLDELPQFWNILKGDMSIVGPRPERKFFIEQIEKQAPYYCLLYNIRPGLLSWGPIKIGYADNIEKMTQRLKYDIIYMDNMSIITDVKIIFYSIEVIFNGKGQ